MQSVSPTGPRQGVGHPIQLELAVRDAVAETADEGAEVGVGRGDVAVERVEPEHDVVEVSVPVRTSSLDHAAVGEDAHARTARVGEREPLDGVSGRRDTELLGGDGGLRA